MLKPTNDGFQLLRDIPLSLSTILVGCTCLHADGCFALLLWQRSGASLQLIPWRQACISTTLCTFIGGSGDTSLGVSARHEERGHGFQSM